jgi:hypothetical protein
MPAPTPTAVQTQPIAPATTGVATSKTTMMPLAIAVPASIPATEQPKTTRSDTRTPSLECAHHVVASGLHSTTRVLNVRDALELGVDRRLRVLVLLHLNRPARDHRDQHQTEERQEKQAVHSPHHRSEVERAHAITRTAYTTTRRITGTPPLPAA